MKKNFTPFIFVMGILTLLPAPARAFSENFKQYMTSVQEKVLLRGKTFSSQDAKAVWDKYDEEVLSLLNDPDQDTHKGTKLNGEAFKEDFIFIDKKGEEIDPIELGSSEIRLYSLGRSKRPLWIAVFQNDLGIQKFGTFHVFGKVEKGKSEDSYQKILSFEDVPGPWDVEKLAASTIQIQKTIENPNKFSSFHLPNGSDNRTQIVWQNLKPVFWYPEVDYYESDGMKIRNRCRRQPI